MFTFKTTTLLFFIILLGMNLLTLAGIPVNWIFYLLLFIVYFGISGAASFFVTTGFHMKAWCRALTTEKVLSLTFDDGPDPEVTPKVLDTLKANNLKATFFLIGRKLEGNEDLVRRMIGEGHIIGTHSFSHSKWFDFFAPRIMKKEFRVTAEKISEITGKKPLLFRPPYGVINPMVKKALSGMNYQLIGFSNRLYDTVNSDPRKIMKRFVKQLAPGDIVVLHDTQPLMPIIVEKMAEVLREKNFSVIPVDQLLNISPYEN